MQIKEIISWHIRIPLRAEFVQSGNSATHSDSVIVAIILADGTTGYGECCPRAYVTGEDASTVLAGLAKARKLLAHTPLHSIETIREFVEERLSGHLGLAATCAIESALLDAFSKYAQAPITQLLAFDWPERIRYSGVAPMRPLHKMGPFLEQLRQFDFKEIKLKIGNCLADNLATIKLVKQYFGDHIRLRVDANCAWGLRDAVEQMPALIEAGATVFEQAFPPEKEEELARATALWGHEAELMVDESVTTFQSAERLIRLGIGNRFNLKISKHGGLFNALKIAHLANRNGIAFQLGAHYGETSMLTACGIIFYALSGQPVAMEGAFGAHLLASDVCKNTLQFGKNACIDAPAEKMSPLGMGYEVAPELLAQYSPTPYRVYNTLANNKLTPLKQNKNENL